MRKLIFLCILNGIFGFAQSQQLISQKITSDEGLPSSEVYSIIQDQEGFIWIGTDNGLAKYDGKKFVLYSTNEGLPDNAILDMYEDIDGILWMSSMSNKISYIKNGVINKFDYSVDSTLPHAPLWSSYIRGRDTTGSAWMNNIFANTILKEVRPGMFRTMFSIDNTIGKNGIDYVLKGIGEYPFNTGDVVHQYLQSDTSYQNYQVETQGEFIKVKGPFLNKNSSDILSFFRNANGHYIGIDRNGFYIQFTENQVLKHGNINLKNILSFYEDRAHNFWILTQNGVALYQNGNLDQVPEVFFPKYMITDMLQDREGNYWFTDHNYGLYKVANINFRQMQIASDPGFSRTSSIKVRNNNLWFSTIDGNIWKIDKKGNALEVFYDQRPAYDFYPFEVLSNDELWLPGNRRLKNGILRKSSQDADDSYNNDKLITKIGNHIYSGVTHGVKKYDLNGRLLFDSEFPTTSDGAKDNFVLRTNAIVQNDYGLWLGCVGGLYLFKSGKFQSYGAKFPVLSSRVMALEQMGSQHLIIGTKGGGVILFDMLTFEFEQLAIEHGLISNMVRSVHWFNNKIYVGTNKGLSVISVDQNLRSTTIINFDIHNGLPSNEISDIDNYLGKIWLATNRGIVYFNPEELYSNTHRPPIYLEMITVNDVPKKFDNSNLELKKDERKIVFSYNGVGFRSGSRIQYKYILSNFDLDTTYTQNTTANYTNLSPGEHTFYVWAKNEDGFWSTKPASLTVFIPKRFNETIWFLALLTAVLIGGATAIFVIFYQRKRKKLENELQTAELKQQALAALMNPHFVYNALAAIQHFINVDNIEKSNLYLSRFARLVRQNLNAVRNGFILLEDEIERLKLYLEIEKMRFGDKLIYEVHIDEEQDLTGLEIPSMIIQPFVENAIWHGILPMERPGRISVSFVITSDDLLEVYIEDNGPGIEKIKKSGEKEHHTSMSMEITRERLELLGQKTGRRYIIEVREPKNGQGMLVYIRIPIDQPNFQPLTF